MKITSPIKILAQATKEMHARRNVRQLYQVWELEHSGLVPSAWLEAGSLSARALKCKQGF